MSETITPEKLETWKRRLAICVRNGMVSPVSAEDTQALIARLFEVEAVARTEAARGDYAVERLGETEALLRAIATKAARLTGCVCHTLAPPEQCLPCEARAILAGPSLSSPSGQEEVR